MSTDNKSPSYLMEREAVRDGFLLNTQDGEMARRILMEGGPGGQARILDDDRCVDWASIRQEFEGCTVLAANCREARAAFSLAQQARSTMGPPGADKGRLVKFFSAPTGYVFRVMAATADPKYWDDPVNVYREALAHPEWCSAPLDVIRGLLSDALPKGTKIEIPTREEMAIPGVRITRATDDAPSRILRAV